MFSKIYTFRKYKFRMGCHVHVMDRKSCRNKRRKKKLLTNHNMGHMTQKENYTVTSHCSLGFCPALEIGFPLSQRARQSLRHAVTVDTTHHLMHRGREIILLLSSDNSEITLLLNT